MSIQEKLAFMAIYAPLFGFLFSLLCHKKQSATIAATVVGMCVSVLSTLLLWIKFGASIAIDVVLFKWIHFEGLHLNWGIKVDPFVMIMLSVVTIISFFVHIYALGYMKHDPNKKRFMGYLSFFTFMMLVLISSPNMVQLFFGWEGVGLASYLLIGFWIERPNAGKAATKAFVVNRIGDAGLILAMALLLTTYGTLDFNLLRVGVQSVPASTLTILGMSISYYELIAFCLLLGAMGKSAQFGLHVWLPDAMEGPTPVSALIHAATMVTAGVFLVVRFSYIFELAPMVKGLLLGIGILTALFAGTVALVQKDIKRVIAYSTCSQLGYMMAACGVGAYGAAVFHLVTHAFFKALLFLGAGSVIHAMSDEQNLTKMGGIYKLIPWTYGFMWIGTLALVGAPFFSGYYSKDAILNAVYLHGHFGSFAVAIGVVALTSFYSIRLLMLAFHGTAKANDYVMAHVHESPAVMLVPLFFLSIGAVCAGCFGAYLFEGIAFDWKNAFALDVLSQKHVPLFIEALPTIMAIIGGMGAYKIYTNNTQKVYSEKYKFLYIFLKHKWWIDEFYDQYISEPLLRLANFLWQAIDIYVIDKFGPNGIAMLSLKLSRKNYLLQTGYVYHYAFIMIVGLLILSVLLFVSFP